VVKKKVIQSLLRAPEQEEPLGRQRSIMLKSEFERNRKGRLYCVCWVHGTSIWTVLLYIVIYKKAHRQLCWYIQ
jgi:hypothetical protein